MDILETERLRLRNWQDTDRDLFREINRDAKVMEYFPYRRSHEEADALMERVQKLIAETGFCFYAVELKETAEPVGFCGLSDPDLAPIIPKGTVEIGWRLATRFWGNGYITEAAKALLAYGFEKQNLAEIVSFAVKTNHRSIAVMRRIGMVYDETADFDHPRVPASHPHLKRHVIYRLMQDEWLAKSHENHA